MKLRSRLMSTKDVMDVLKKKSRSCQKLIRIIKLKKRKPKHSFITTKDFADHMNVPEKVVHDILDEVRLRRNVK